MSNNSIWEGDLLNRKNEGDYIVTYLTNRYQSNKDSSFVLNINAEWGFGKTYFLNNLAKDLKDKKHPVIYFDAWKNDFTDNPLLAFMSEINSSLEPFLSRSIKAQGFLKGAYNTSKKMFLPAVIKKLTGYGVDEFFDLLEDKEVKDDTNPDNAELKSDVTSVLTNVAELALKEHNGVKESIKTFNEQMQKLLSHIDKNLSIELPLFVLIDELDRCRPNYAIELLENIKHVFDIPGIVFIVATDSQQLAHSINAIYGNNFSSERYLKRFFNQEYNLAKPDNYSYANYLFENYNLLDNDKLFSPLDTSIYRGTNLFVELFCGYSAFFKLGLRDQEQVVIMLEAIVLVWKDEDKIHLGYLLFLSMLKQKNNESFIKLNETLEKDRTAFVTREFLAKVDVDMTVYFKDYQYASQGGLREIEYSVYMLIVVYLDLLDINYGQFTSKYERSDISRKIDKKIAQIIRGQIKGYPDIKTIMTKSLSKYPNLVLRAGQFS